MPIRIKIAILASAETIFKAITTRNGYQHWWTKTCDVDCRPGGVSSIRFEKKGFTEEMCFKTMEVLEGKKLVWRCTVNNVFETWIGSTLSFEIEDGQKSSLLLFTQESPDKKWNRHPDHQPSLAGWKSFMESLKNYCETGQGEPWE